LQYRFFYKELQWKYLNSDNIWIAQNPPLPDWAEQFLPIFFVKIWVKSRYMNDIHKALFWLSRTEIENYYEEINLALQECGYEELHDLEYSSQGIFSDEDLILLEKQGYINKVENIEPISETEADSDEYDAMKALLEQKNKARMYEPLQHISTTETGKFSIRH
jgi:poly-D-alanine transfer protein DltD